MNDDELSRDISAAANRGDKIPAAWQPYSEQIDQIGSAIVHLPRPGATHRDLLIGAGFDPDAWQIAGPVKTRKWQRYDQEWLYWYAFDVVAGESSEHVQTHVDELVKVIRKRTPTTPRFTGASDAWVYVAADWQVGKAEGDSGTEQTITRVLESLDMAKQQVKDLRRLGRRMPHGALVGLGDLVEGCAGFYPNQPFLIDRNRRDQGKITRELVTHAIDELSPLFDVFTAATVGGNHGENRQDGKKVTDDADNDDVAAFEAVREAYDRAGQYIDWVIPSDELSIALELGGVQLGLTHGHTFRRGSTPQQKAHEWWKGQVFGMQAVQHAQILLSGHFHHWSLVTLGSRTIMQAPANDPGSKWYRDSSGEESPAGVLTMRLDAGHVLGYDDLRILSPGRG